MDQKPKDDGPCQVDLPVHREAVRTITSRGRTHKGVGRDGCIVGVKRRSENRGRGVDGVGDGGGSDDVTNRVRGVRLGGFEERSENAVVFGVKKVDEDDEGGEDAVDVHGGRIGGCPVLDAAEGGGRGRRCRNRKEAGWAGLYTRTEGDFQHLRENVERGLVLEPKVYDVFTIARAVLLVRYMKGVTKVNPVLSFSRKAVQPTPQHCQLVAVPNRECLNFQGVQAERKQQPG
jgi:hypothetical protein